MIYPQLYWRNLHLIVRAQNIAPLPPGWVIFTWFATTRWTQTTTGWIDCEDAALRGGGLCNAGGWGGDCYVNREGLGLEGLAVDFAHPPVEDVVSRL